MSQQANYFKLGLFVIVGVCLLVAGVVVLGVGALLTEKVMVETAVAESVQGLDVGASVDFKGVKIGKVKSIQLASERYKAQDEAHRLAIAKYVLIEMEIERALLPADQKALDERLQLARQAGLRVRMAQAGLTGPSYLEVLYVDPTQYPEPKLPFDPQALYVPSTPSFVETITTGVEALAMEMRDMKLSEVTQNTNKLLVDLRQSLADLQLKKVGDHAVATMDQAQAMSQRMRELLAKPEVEKMITDASAAVASARDTLQNPDIKTVVADLPKISANLRSTTEQIDKLVHDPALQKTMEGMSQTATNAVPATVELRRTLRELATLLASQRRDIELLLTSLRRASENAAALTEDVRENPSRMLFGQPPPKTEP